MICSNCNKVELICCSETIVIGDAPSLVQTFYLHIEDVSNGRKIILPVSVTGGGVMFVDVSEFQFAETHSYEMYITTTDDVSTIVPFEINGTEVSCLQVRFKKYFDSNNEVVFVTSQDVVIQ